MNIWNLIFNRDKINIAIEELCDSIEKWLKTEENLNQVMDGLAKGSQQLEVLKAAAAHPQHHLYSLHSRYQSRKDASEAMIKAQIGLKQKLEECGVQLSHFKVRSCSGQGCLCKQVSVNIRHQMR